MRTTTLRPFARFSTLTFVPKGNVRCAAVSACGSQRSPEAVFDVSAYHEARPVCADASPLGARLETMNMVAASAPCAELSIGPFFPVVSEGRGKAFQNGRQSVDLKKNSGSAEPQTSLRVARRQPEGRPPGSYKVCTVAADVGCFVCDPLQ